MITNTVSNQLLGTVYNDPTWDLCSSGIFYTASIGSFATIGPILHSQAVQEECQEHFGILPGLLDPSTLDNIHIYERTRKDTPRNLLYVFKQQRNTAFLRHAAWYLFSFPQSR